MSKALARIAGMGLAALLLLPTAARAGIIDVIYGMSGPQLVGLVLARCEFNLESPTVNPCRLPWALVQPTSPRLWVDLDAALYLSTGKNSEGREYKAWDIAMIAFDPIVGTRSHNFTDSVFLHHGAGLTLNWLYGGEFGHIWKAGIKIQPAAIAFSTGRFDWDAALTLRVYPDKYTAADFGLDPSGASSLDKRKELVKGFTIGLRF